VSAERPDDIWEAVAAARAARHRVVVASVVRDFGSVPRRCGAKMLVGADGSARGTIGGGVFESRVIRDALAALAAGESVTRGYAFNPEARGDSGGDATFGAVCGGRVEIFLEVVMPGQRLIVVGGGHCGRALARAASLLNFSIVVADDRKEYARPKDFEFPGVEAVLHLPPDFTGMPEPDAQTAVALVSKGYVTDTAALRRVIRSQAAYIGMMGSVQKRDVVFAALRKEGVDDTLLARVRAPIGLEIGAESPEEIAVSILAELIQIRSRREARAAGT
jgi:xanthine dehydrogenase accessory factor